jgi:D-3-phosphoglycerate dehydrogenase
VRDRLSIVIAEDADFSQEALTLLQGIADVDAIDLSGDRAKSDLARADVLWVRLGAYVDEEILDAAPHLKAIVTATTGLNHIDLDAAEQRGINVLSLRGETEFLKTVRATAELTLALTLALLRRIPVAVSQVHDGLWDRDLVKGGELYGKTVGIIGYGRLGRIVADYFNAFGSEVLAHDTAAVTAEPGIELVSLDALLKRADIVSLHVNYAPENHEFLGAPQFDAMRQGAIFVNTARGELIDEQVLLAALQSGKLAGAALDVIQNEQQLSPADRLAHPLIRFATEHDNLVITPHIGGCTGESMRNTEVFLAKKVMDTLQPR